MEPNHSNLVSSKISFKKLIFTALISASTLFAAHAGGKLPEDKYKQASVTSLGVANGSMVFNLKYENPNEDKLSIVLKDNTGVVLYKDIMTVRNVDKTFKTAGDIGDVILIVTNLKDKTSQKFSISNEKRFVEEVLITSVN